MFTIDRETFRKIDDDLIAEDIPLAGRPLHFIIRYMRLKNMTGNFLSEEKRSAVMAAYKERYPSGDFSIGSKQIGCFGFKGQAFLIRVPLAYGTVSINFVDCLQITVQERGIIFKESPHEGWRAIYAVADLFDFAYGFDDLRGGQSQADEMWSNAASSLEATSRCLVSGSAEDTVVQNAHLSAELSMKGLLSRLNYTDKKLRSLGHSLPDIAEAVIGECSTANDSRLRSACQGFPDYVKTRYSAHKLTRVQLVDLAIKSQFIAGESLRRASDRNTERVVQSSPGGYPRIFP